MVSLKGIKSFVGTFQYQANHLFCRGRKTFITNSDKCYTLTIPNIVIWGIMPCVDFELQDVQTIYIMGNHFHLWQGIHIVTNPTTDALAYMLYVIKTFDNTIIINAEKKGTTQTISKGAYALQPTLRFLFFKHHLEVVCSTFSYQSL